MSGALVLEVNPAIHCVASLGDVAVPFFQEFEVEGQPMIDLIYLTEVPPILLGVSLEVLESRHVLLNGACGQLASSEPTPHWDGGNCKCSTCGHFSAL